MHLWIEGIGPLSPSALTEPVDDTEPPNAPPTGKGVRRICLDGQWAYIIAPQDLQTILNAAQAATGAPPSPAQTPDGAQAPGAMPANPMHAMVMQVQQMQQMMPQMLMMQMMKAMAPGMFPDAQQQSPSQPLDMAALKTTLLDLGPKLKDGAISLIGAWKRVGG